MPDAFILLQNCHTKIRSVSVSFKLADSLEESSIPSGTSLLRQEASKAKKPRDFVLVHGDERTRYLARAFRGIASKIRMEGPE